jgi:hypothetical protein
MDEKCTVCANTIALAPRCIEALEYFISEFSRHRRDKLAYVLGNGQWNQFDFERDVLRPVFATAKHVKIYDRYIGRSLVNSKGGIVRFSDNYKRTLEWMIQVFRDVGGASRGGVFEIYCGIGGRRISSSKRARIRTEMQNFEAAAQAGTGIPVQIFLKQESLNAQCPHGRYLATDQATVLIERGFDLLWDDNTMQAAGLNPAADPRPIRDVAVVLCNNFNAVDAQTRSLPPF